MRVERVGEFINDVPWFDKLKCHACGKMTKSRTIEEGLSMCSDECYIEYKRREKEK
jgi:predicted nucleic acid-binding Zn ribbon protein